MKINNFTRLILGFIYGASCFSLPAHAQDVKIEQGGQCDLDRLKEYEADFDKLIQIKTQQGNSANAAFARDMEISALKYIKENEKCFNEIQQKSAALTGQTARIDEGGLWMTNDGPSVQGATSAEFLLFGTKWGPDSPYLPEPNLGGQNGAGPRTPGGIVTYSFVGNGVSNAAEGAENNTRFSSLPTYSACFETEITRAFSMWSAVANIDFVQVNDNGADFNDVGATGDIRIGSHFFDGSFGTLAHAFLPPVNGQTNTAPGDLHFDRSEPWTCDASGFDIGIVATHEIGHSIGLSHEEQGALAIMNPFYDPNVASLTTDDILGAQSIYGDRAISIPEPEPPISSAIVTFLDEELPVVIPYERNPIDDQCNSSIGLDPEFIIEAGTWINACVSRNRAPALAQFYSFTLSEQTNVTIDLNSTIDTYLYLLSRNGSVIEFDDDGGNGLNSSITRTLVAGRYMIEATTFSTSGLTGDFSLTLRSN